MNWKEFLKLNKRKTILFIIILFFFVIFTLIQMRCFALSVRCEPIFYNMPLLFLANLFALISFDIIIPINPIPIIEAYFLSCLIIWIYNKKKKVMKK